MLWSDPGEVSGAAKKDHVGVCAALLEDLQQKMCLGVLVPTRVLVLCSTGHRNEAGGNA